MWVIVLLRSTGRSSRLFLYGAVDLCKLNHTVHDTPNISAHLLNIRLTAWVGYESKPDKD